MIDTVVLIRHTSVSGCHSPSAFGDEDSIDKNSPKMNKTAMIAPASIEHSHFSYRFRVQLSRQSFDFFGFVIFCG